MSIPEVFSSPAAGPIGALIGVFLSSVFAWFINASNRKDGRKNREADRTDAAERQVKEIAAATQSDLRAIRVDLYASLYHKASAVRGTPDPTKQREQIACMAPLFDKLSIIGTEPTRQAGNNLKNSLELYQMATEKDWKVAASGLGCRPEGAESAKQQQQRGEQLDVARENFRAQAAREVGVQEAGPSAGA